MKHEYVIHVTKTGSKSLDGKWVAVFTADTTSSDKYVTFCALRKFNECSTPFAGCSVKHPNDVPDDNRGLHDSFKRAVKAMVEDFLSNNDEAMYSYIDEKTIKSRFMGAFWIAMGRPGYKKEESVIKRLTEIAIEVNQLFQENEV